MIYFASTAADLIVICMRRMELGLAIYGTLRPILRFMACWLGGLGLHTAFPVPVSATPLSQVTWSSSASNNLGLVAVSSATGRILVAYNSAVMASTDDGSNWTAATQGLQGLAPAKIFASGSGSFFAVCGSNGIFRLANGSLTWTKVFFATGYVTHIAESPDGGVLGCVTAEGNLYRSLDGGESWALLAGGIPGTGIAPQLGLAVVDEHTFLYSFYLFQVYRTTDDGATFSEATGLPPSSPTALLVNQQNPSQLLVGSYWDGVYRSNDGGQTWTAFRTGLPEGRGVSNLAQGPDGAIYAMVRDQTGGAGLYKLPAGGSAWEEFTGSIAFPVRNATNSFGVNSAGDVYAAFGLWGLLRRPHDQSVWGPVNTGRSHGQPPYARSLSVDLSDRLYCGVNGTSVGPHGGLGIFTTGNQGASWSVSGEDYTDADVISLAGDENNYTYASSYWFKVMRSLDGGVTWSNPGSFRFPSSPTQLLAVRNHLYVGSYWNGVYVSDDKGVTWNSMTGLPADRGVGSLAALGDNRLIALVYDQFGTVGPYRTDLAVNDWEPNFLGLPVEAIPALCGVGRGGANGVGYVWGAGWLFQQATTTSNWAEVARPGGFNVLCVVPSPVGGTLAGTDGGGVFHRDETAGTWEKVGDTRLDGKSVQALTLGRDGTIYAGTNDGIFSVQPGNFADLLPVITVQPQNQTVTMGGAVSFGFTALGEGLTFQWEKNGVPIPGASGSTFDITTVQVGDTASYRIVVSNLAGYTVSQEATLKVNSRFEAWRLDMFTPEELADPSKSAPAAVYGHDACPNLVKYALGLEPKQDGANLLSVSVDGADWIYAYTRPSDMPDIIYEVQISTDLTTWTTDGVTHGFVSSSGGIDSWQAHYPLSSSTNVFFRLKVSMLQDFPLRKI